MKTVIYLGTPTPEALRQLREQGYELTGYVPQPGEPKYEGPVIKEDTKPKPAPPVATTEDYW